jgi:hypothetical protein
MRTLKISLTDKPADSGHAVEADAVGLGRSAADSIDNEVNLVSLAQYVERREGHADFGPRGAEMSLRRPVAWTALRNSTSSQKLVVVRSSGLPPGAGRRVRGGRLPPAADDIAASRRRW